MLLRNTSEADNILGSNGLARDINYFALTVLGKILISLNIGDLLIFYFLLGTGEGRSPKLVDKGWTFPQK